MHPSYFSYPITLYHDVLSYGDLSILPSLILILILILDFRYEFREAALREAVLLLARAVAETYLHPTTPAPLSVHAVAGEGSTSMGTNGSNNSNNAMSSSSSSGSGSGSDGSATQALSSIEGHLVVSLVFLQARCTGECDVVPDVAKR
jgi:uncharacterized membrane protein YgcG